MKAIRSEEDLGKRLSTYLKAGIEDAGLTYNQLADKLVKHGLPGETKESIRGKLKRGSFPATFFVAVVVALGLTKIDLKDL